MNTGAGKATSLNPRLATRVPWVNWATDAPTMVDSVSIELTSRWPNGWVADQAASRCSACEFMVSVVNSELSPSVIVRPGRCRYRTPTSNSSKKRPRCSIASPSLTVCSPVD